MGVDMSKKLSAKQKTLNKGARHLRKQGKKSRENGKCLYRGPNGTRCPVGAMIPNRLYTVDLENQTPYCDDVETILKTLGYDVDVATDLQCIHDSNDVEDWEKLLATVADKFNLVLPPPR
jgi:hypothetical protein